MDAFLIIHRFSSEKPTSMGLSWGEYGGKKNKSVPVECTSSSSSLYMWILALSSTRIDLKRIET